MMAFNVDPIKSIGMQVIQPGPNSFSCTFLLQIPKKIFSPNVKLNNREQH